MAASNIARKNAAPAARLALVWPTDDINRQLQETDDQGYPADTDHRDPRQTEQWLPVPTADPDDDYITEEEMFRRLDALALDADERGVLNYYNINRGHNAPYHDRAHLEEFEMSKEDICNVEFLSMGALDAIMGDLIDVAETQQEMEDLNCRWNLATVS